MSFTSKVSLLGIALTACVASSSFAKDAQASEGNAANGFYVYKEVCSTCHAMRELHYGDFRKLDIPAKTLQNWTATRSVPDGLDDKGNLKLRPGTLDDIVASKYPTESAARKDNGGDLPLDLSSISLLIKGGNGYIHDMLLDYQPVPEGMKLKDKEFYNPIALTHHHHFHMPSPWTLAVTQNVVYPGNVHPTEKQMADDVTAFLKWSATPYQSKRIIFGYFAVGYSAIMAVIFFLLRRKVWSDLPD